jgi:hemerythrin
MALIGWLPTYTVHIPPIDAQHKRLFDLLNRLHDAIVAKECNRDTIANTIEQLIRYTKTHFALEERFLESMQYPELAKHKLKHEALTIQVEKLQQEFATGKTAIASELMNFMLAWLTDHILHTDKRYAAFLKGERLQHE